MAEVAGEAGGGEARANVNENGDGTHVEPKGWRAYVVYIPMKAVYSLRTIVRVHLGNGITRVKAGERLEHPEFTSVVRSRGVMERFRGGCNITGLPSSAITTHIELAPEKEWMFMGEIYSDSVVVEGRQFWDRRGANFENYVIVLREGLALPTGTLLFAVNHAHAVLVLGDDNRYFYIHNDFVLSTSQEQALKEWGVGRPPLANSLLAVGGTLLVALAENIWAPAVVGTLLVAAAGYRVQGALTKVLRVRSPEWESMYMLVPSGILGAERAMQGALVTLVALADLLDHRWLLLAALIFASVQVVWLEYEGQARLTWERKKYNRILCMQLGVWAGCCFGLAAWLWLAYVFAGLIGCLGCGFVLSSVLSSVLSMVVSTRICSCDEECQFKVLVSLGGLASVGVGIGAAVLGWNDADLKFSRQSLLPWRWPLVEPAPDSFSTFVRLVGLWVGLGVGCFIVVYIAVGVFSFRISSDGGRVVGSSERILARKGSPNFSHYRVSSIPSRNLLERKTRDVEQQALVGEQKEQDLNEQAQGVGQQAHDVELPAQDEELPAQGVEEQPQAVGQLPQPQRAPFASAV